MAALDMTEAEREAFLGDLHVGVLAIARDDKGPLALPIWYRYVDGEVVLSMSGSSVKAILLRRHGRATLTVQNEQAPYKYVSVEGPVTLSDEHTDIVAMATRYLGDEMGQWYADNNPQSDDSVTVKLTPERWLTIDYAKS